MPTPSDSPIALVWQNQPLTVTAKVDAVINPTDTLLWEHEFVAALLPDPWGGTYELAWNGVDRGCTYGAQQLSGGLWRFTARSGVDVASTIEITAQDNGEILGTLSAPGDIVEITLPPDRYRYVDLLQNAGLAVAAIEMQRVAYWDTNGYPPTMTAAGHQFTAHWDYSPRQGVLTARAKAYDGNNFLIATSADIYLNIIGSNSGGC